MTQLTKICFVRHGETDWNRCHLEMGSRDVPLNAHGLEQASLAARRLQSKSIVQIVSSPLQRASKTAEIVAETLGKNITIIHEFSEHGIDPKTNARESIETFEGRLKYALQKALALTGPVLIVAHGDVYWTLQEILGILPDNLQNCQTVYCQPPLENDHLWTIHDL